jgi:hypothetical protein
MPKKRVLRLVPKTGDKLAEVAESTAVVALLLSAFFAQFLHENPKLANKMVRALRAYAKEIEPEYRNVIKRALATIEAIQKL